MIRLSILVVGLMVSSGIAGARTLSVRSGEHEKFSRLVIRLPEGSEWQVREAKSSAQVVVDLDDVLFDTSQVFERIPRTRLASLGQKSAGAPLRLVKNCDCSVRAFVQPDEQPGLLLVVDLMDPPAPAEPPSPARSAFSASPYRFRTVAASRLAYEFPMTYAGLEFGQNVGGGGTASRPLPPDRNVELPNLLSLPDKAQSSALGMFQIRLLEQISRATDQGLLTSNLPPPGQQPESYGHGDAPPSGMMAAAEAEVAEALRVVTSIDRDMPRISLTVGEQPEVVACPEPGVAALQDWADERPFGMQVGELRSALYSEFDVANLDGVRDLARLYLGFGFGAEALAVLEVENLPEPEDGILRVMADVIDGRPLTQPNRLAGLGRCSPQLALWAFMTKNGPVPKLEMDQRNQILRSYAALPEHMKALLGPRLSKRFLDSGDAATAGDILRATNRGQESGNTGVELANAELDIDRGRTRMARERLQKVVSENTEQSPEALARLIDIQLADGGSVGTEIAELAAAFAVEYRGTELGERLGHARALALAMSGQFDEAFREIPESGNPDRQKAVMRTRNALLGLLTDRADDVTFLALAMAELDRQKSSRPVALGNAVARRMLDLGFPDLADRYLIEPETARNTVPRRLLRAEIALARAKPNLALLELSGLSGEDVLQLRARALAATGAYRGAATAYLGIPDRSAVAHAYWLSGAWDQAVENGDGKFRAASRIAMNLMEEKKPSGAVGQLAAADELLSASERTRAEILQLRQTIQTGSPDP